MKMRVLAVKTLWFQTLFALVLLVSGCRPDEPVEPEELIEIETGLIEEIGSTHCIIHGGIIDVGLDGIYCATSGIQGC